MFKKIKFITAAALVGILLFSCAQEKIESNASVQKRVLDAYLRINYPNNDYTVTESGLVILTKTDGEGITPANKEAAYLWYNVKDLNGNYQSVMDKDLSKFIGTYSDANYYGPQLYALGYGEVVEGMGEAMKMMNKGSEMTVIIPPSLSKYDAENNGGYGYSTEQSETVSVNLIYEIKMGDVVTNLQKYQRDSLEKYRDIYYPGLDSTANMFYFKKLDGVATDTIEKNETAYVWYVGRLLDGYIFDTNIADTAKKYGIYSAEKTYEALEVTYEETYEEMATGPGTINVSGNTSNSSDDESGSYVPGFAKALKCMKYGDHAIAFFGSGWGYGSTSSMSSGSGIPSYSMLFFEMFVSETDVLE